MVSSVEYRLVEGRHLDIRIRAVTDTATIVNIRWTVLREQRVQ